MFKTRRKAGKTEKNRKFWNSGMTVMYMLYGQKLGYAHIKKRKKIELVLQLQGNFPGA